MKILLVEDSRTSVMLVETLLKDDPDETYDLHVVGTLADGVAKITREDFDLVLLDLTLPDSSGVATVDAMFEAADGTGIVVLTSTSDEKVGLAALRHGAQDFLVKDETYRKVLLRAIKYARQRSQAEREIREARDLAEFATRSKSTFIANLSHELRTPLNAVIGFSEIMLGGIAGEMNDKQKEYTTDIYKSGRYLLGLIGTVLDISKIEANKIELNNGVVNIASVIDDVVELYQGVEHNDKATIRLDIEPRLPKFYGDLTMVTEIVTNLISNALKYSPDGGEVFVKAFVDGAGELKLTVQDHGIGIAADEIENILEPFGRTETSRKHNIEGTGLGLPLTVGLVEAHGGKLSLDSELGEGTTVCVSLPQDRLRA